MKVGIVGLPASGKSTLFRALTGARAEAAPGPHAPRLAAVPVADPRVDRLAALIRPKKVTYAQVEYAYVPGLGTGPAGRDRAVRRTEADAIPPALQAADALLLVLRAFEDPAVPHPRGSVDPARDLADAHLELLLRDLTVVERRAERLAKSIPKTGRAEEKEELALLERLRGELEGERPLRALSLSEEESPRLKGFGFLSAKPLLAVVNADEEQLRSGAYAEPASALGIPSEEPGLASLTLCAKLEAELAELSLEDRAAFLEDYGIETPARERVVAVSLALLGLITFFTGNERELRAWTVPRGTTALRAAGTVHSDLERGFIRAEVLGWEDLLRLGGLAAAREKGQLRLEGKDYPVQDGDVIQVRFHV
ncbi:MAG: DUF933 domain-containing protein [Nitrospinota bacterium]